MDALTGDEHLECLTSVDALPWTPWMALGGIVRERLVPVTAGLYRIRRVDRDDLDYVGQTGDGGMTLRARLRMLSGVYAEKMPYSDPHTAAPALWALRHATGCAFEVSVLPVVAESAWRKGLEALVISLYRQERGVSPTVNFGRMPPGYRKSSGNNRALIAAGRRFRGGPHPEPSASHAPGIAPMGPLTGHPFDPDWCGHAWSPWDATMTVLPQMPRAATGLYRVRRQGATGLAYIGQGQLRQRIGMRFTMLEDALPDDVSAIEVSWVQHDGWLPNQRLELENDLIAAHMLAFGEPPLVQFGWRR